jgi:hypothetical protein
MTPPANAASGEPGVRRKLAAALAAALALLAFLAVLLERRAEEELEAARAFAAQGDYKAADRHYFQALNWYAPWGSSQKAADELMALGLEHLRSGRDGQAFQSLLRLRSALVAARSFYQPRPDLLEAATPILAISLARQKLGPEASQEDISSQAAIYHSLYVSAAAREQRWYFLIVFSFLLWVGAAFHFIFSFFRPQGPRERARDRKAAYAAIAVFFYGYLMWLFSMTMS